MIEVAIRKRLGAFTLDAAFATEGRGVTALFGRSGSGKTSLINAVAGLLRPDSGTIRIGGTVFFDAERRIDLKPEKRRVGYVFQDARLFPHMRVEANLTYGLRRTPASERRIGLEPVVELLGLGPLLGRRPHGLSGGEKQRVALGRALLAQPRVLLMDEPLASLDMARKAEVIPYIERLRDELGIPIILVSHDIDEVVRLAATLVLVENGCAVAAGPLPDVLARLEVAHLTGLHDAGAVLEVRVASHDPDWDLTILDFAGGRLRVPRLDLPVGVGLRIRIPARDVILSLSVPTDLSANNVLTGRIEAMSAEGGPFRDVRLDVGGSPLIARVTRQSAERLGLAPGMVVQAVIKAVAFDRRSLEFSPILGRHCAPDGLVQL